MGVGWGGVTEKLLAGGLLGMRDDQYQGCH